MTPRRARESGAALLTAMIIVTLITTMAGSMVLQQWRAVQVEIAERARAQAAWILQGALDWSRLILREDARTSAVDHLGEPWAVPLAEARLSTFLAADRDNADDAPEAFLSGRIDDAQAKFNLRNLIDGDKPSIPAVAALRRLCESADVAPDLADKLAAKLVASVVPPTDEQGAATAPVEPMNVDQLGWLGVDTESLKRLRPFVTLLPAPTPVNINTASREVLAAVVEGLDLASAERLVGARTRQPYNSLDDAKADMPATVQLLPEVVGVGSTYFEITGRLRLGERVLNERSLVQRQGTNVITLRRQTLGTIVG